MPNVRQMWSYCSLIKQQSWKSSKSSVNARTSFYQVNGFLSLKSTGIGPETTIPGSHDIGKARKWAELHAPLPKS